MDRFARPRRRLRHACTVHVPETQSGTAADTHTGAATGSLSGMEVRRRSSSLQSVTIQRRPEARHFRLWRKSASPAARPSVAARDVRERRAALPQNRDASDPGDRTPIIAQHPRAPLIWLRCFSKCQPLAFGDSPDCECRSDYPGRNRRPQQRRPRCAKRRTATHALAMISPNGDDEFDARQPAGPSALSGPAGGPVNSQLGRPSILLTRPAYCAAPASSIPSAPRSVCSACRFRKA